mgnify:FL=1
MNEHFRIAQKLGLMFRPEEPLPKDIEAWALKQLYSPSPAIGIDGVESEPTSWPKSLRPNLEERARMRALYMDSDKKSKLGIDGEETAKALEIRHRKYLMRKKDELKYVHRNIYGSDQLRLRLMSFWTNHFTIGYGHDYEQAIGHAIDEAILANINTSFSSMLYSITTHPGMLNYLDNTHNAGPNSEYVKRMKKEGKQAGLNDNLGRELLELHTLSPSANYTETDIRNTALVLTGWGGEMNEYTLNKRIKKEGKANDWIVYDQFRSEPGNKTILGKTIYPGKNGLRQLTDFLALNEHTIMHLSRKLAEHFVSDVPKKTDVDFIANAWRQNKGDLNKIHTAVIEKAISSKEEKFQWPMTWLFQLLRLSEATYIEGWTNLKLPSRYLMKTGDIFEELGQSFWSIRQPNGYSSKKEDWMSSEMFERRVRFADAVWQSGKPKQTPAMIMDRIGANKSTRNLVSRWGTQQSQFVALMCSPELMGLENA